MIKSVIPTKGYPNCVLNGITTQTFFEIDKVPNSEMFQNFELAEEETPIFRNCHLI